MEEIIWRIFKVNMKLWKLSEMMKIVVVISILVSLSVLVSTCQPQEVVPVIKQLN